MVRFKTVVSIIVSIIVGVSVFKFSTYQVEDKSELVLSPLSTNKSTPSDDQEDQSISGCAQTYSISLKIGDSDVIKGNLALRRFPLDTDVMIQFTNIENGESSPPGIIETTQNLYSGIRVSDNLDKASISGLIQLYALMQWSNGLAKTTEHDNNGLMAVAYNSDYLSKSKSGYINTTKNIAITGKSSAVKSDNGCFHKIIKGEDTYKIKHPVNRSEYTYTSLYKYSLTNENMDNLPVWMKGSKQDIESYVLNFKMKAFETRKQMTLSQLNEVFKKNNRSDLKSAILLALKDEGFVTEFISKLISDPDSLNTELSIDIIMYMSHADTNLTQRAILTLLENSDVLPLDFALQSAITAGEFSGIKDPSYANVAFDLFQNTDNNDVIRSAIISSLGRMVNKIQEESPSLASDITSSLTTKLSEVSSNNTDSLYLLDALSNAKVNSEEVLTVTEPYLTDDSAPVFKRAVSVYMKSGGQGYLEDLLESTEDSGKQSILITALSKNPVKENEASIANHMFSENIEVKVASIRYLANLNSITDETIDYIKKLDKSERDISVRKAMLSVISKNIDSF